MVLLAAVLAGLAAWLLVPSTRVQPSVWTWRPVLILGSGLGGWGVVSGWLPVRAGILIAAVVLVVTGGRLIWQRRRRRRARATTAVGVLEACEVLAAELVAGRPPGHALAEAARRWSGLSPVVDAWLLGSDVPSALRRAAGAPGAGDLRVVAAAWQVAHHSGNGLAHALSRVASRIRAQRQTQRVVTSELASARATARLVAALPVVALGMGSGAGGDPWRFLLDTPVGWGCLVAGLGFGIAGLWWIEAIADQVDPGVIVLAAILAGVAVLLLLPPRASLRASVGSPTVAQPPAAGSARWRPVLCLLAGLGVGLFLGGPVGVVAAPVAAVGAWVGLVRSEPTAVRREREEVARELPAFVDLFGCALRAGASPQAALAAVVAASPGPLGPRLQGAHARLRMGVDPMLVWGGLADDDVLAALGRTLARAEASGTSVADAVERLADELERSALATLEDRARAVGVKAAVPLGLCLLPAFLLIGIVPTVAGLLTTLTP